ncbi:ABC transporter substrate-binding protein [Treponema primitia]|uniref:ABC transporter substrate-binding protein n=1 Tax=Treponema primitia TaxID=88058 RepID=UPI0002555351|nr:ABC transporter substrate-binding protein [Treponema primitia]
MKNKLSAIVLVLVVLALAGCGRKQTPGTVRVILDWTPNTNHTGLYVALEKGYYKEEGLEVEILQPPEDGAMVLVAAGNAEFAVGFQESLGPALAQDSAPLPVTAVAAIISHNTSGIISLKQAGILSPRDLSGKRYASWETPLVTEIIRTIVEDDGGDFGSIKMIPNFATDAFSALATDVDAIWIYYAWDGIAAEINGVGINYLDLGQINSNFDFYTPVLVTNDKYAAAKPDEVKKFLRATSRGYTFAIENPADAGAILLKHAPELDRDLVISSQEYLASRYQADAPRWGEIDPKRWAAFYGWMFDKGLLGKDIRNQGFTNQYLP